MAAPQMERGRASRQNRHLSKNQPEEGLPAMPSLGPLRAGSVFNAPFATSSADGCAPNAQAPTAPSEFAIGVL